MQSFHIKFREKPADLEKMFAEEGFTAKGSEYTKIIIVPDTSPVSLKKEGEEEKERTKTEEIRITTHPLKDSSYAIRILYKTEGEYFEKLIAEIDRRYEGLVIEAQKDS